MSLESTAHNTGASSSPLAMAQSEAPIGQDSCAAAIEYVLEQVTVSPGGASHTGDIKDVLGQVAATLGGDSTGAGVSDPSLVPSITNRLEALIEQQNLLMQRQVQLAEENSKVAQSTTLSYKAPRQFLKTLDPRVRGIFASWQKDFCGKLGVYVAQCELSTK